VRAAGGPLPATAVPAGGDGAAPASSVASGRGPVVELTDDLRNTPVLLAEDAERLSGRG
jgi:hypothetical protein